MDRQKRYSNPQSNSTFQPPSYRQTSCDRINPGRPELHSSSPLIGIIDQGFGTGQHGAEVVEVITQENPQALTWLGQGVGSGTWAKSLTEFVDTAKTSGHPQAVVNLSFDLVEQHPDGQVRTRSQFTTEEHQALTYAHDNGVLIVASAGNTGTAMSALGQASAQFDNIIAVGAAEGNQRASYSSYGNGLDLVAPGRQADDSLMGTSRSTAAVTSAIAQIWQANPTLNYQQVTRTLESTATDLQTPGWDSETGSGLLNSKAAINLARTTLPETLTFSGAQLIQPDNLAAWKPTNGAISAERLAWSWSDIGHTALDVIGTIDPTPISDGVNAAWYAAEGDYTNAAISAASMLPGGDIAKVGKWAAKGVKAAKEANGARRTVAAAERQVEPVAARSPATLTQPMRRVQRDNTTDRVPVQRTSSGPKPKERTGTDSPSRSSGLQRSRREAVPDRVVRRETAPVSAKPKPRVRTTQPEVPRKGSPASPPSSGSTQPRGLDHPRGSHPRETGTRSTTPKALQTSSHHQIRKGDTLWEIAEARLGNGARWRELRKSDGRAFTEQEARRLQPGETVVVPKAKSDAAQPATRSPWNPAPRKPIDPTPHIHTTRDLTYQNDSWLQSQLDRIRPGESLSDFADRIKTKVRDHNSNPLSESEVVVPGAQSNPATPAVWDHSGRQPITSAGLRAKFMKIQLNTILAAPNHPLRFLVDETTGQWKSRQLYSQEIGVQAGHTQTRAGLDSHQPETLAVEDALDNQMDSRTTESRGGFIEKAVINIDGVPVMRHSARMWEKIGLLPRGTVQNAPAHPGYSAHTQR